MGDAASGLIGFGGDTVQNAANAGGNMLRDLGEEVGLETPFDAMAGFVEGGGKLVSDVADGTGQVVDTVADVRSEEHTSELQSLMRISYAVFCLNKKKTSK